MSLFSRTQELPGLHGALRDCTPGGNGMKKFRAGDIAVINAANISRQEAQALIDVQPVAVVNVAEFSTEIYPELWLAYAARCTGADAGEYWH